ncbi:MAG: hypothetical protein IID30_13325 [Planctomycetes bacterium]|nr:hypothetical protein [Planctomycetota bacterium]
MLAHVRTLFQPFHKLLIAGAWFFIIFSLLRLAWAIGVKLDHPEGITKLYYIVMGNEVYDAWGLTYTGVTGLVQAFMQAAIVIAAATATLLSPRGPRTVKLRRIGHSVLCVWSAWWAMNLIRLAGIDQQMGSYVQAAFLSGLFGCNGYRALCGWRKQAPGQQSETSPPAIQVSCTEALFVAITPDESPVLPPESPVTDEDAETETSAETTNKPSLFARLGNFWKEKVVPCFSKPQVEAWREKANQVAHRGHVVVVKNARHLARRARPAAQTALREAKKAWHKTVESLKETKTATSSHVEPGQSA